MFLFNRKVATGRVVSVRPAAIEGLEGRRMLSGSPMGGGLPGGNSSPGGPGINMPQQNPNSGKNAGAEIKGVVTLVDVAGSKITVAEEKGGPTVVFAVPASASITVKDTTGGLAAIKAGAQIDIRLSPVDGSVVSVSAENPQVPNGGHNDDGNDNEVEGTINAIDTVKGQLTVTAEHSATPVVFTIPTTAKITLNGKPAALTDLAVGSSVEIHFAADGVTIVSVEVTSALT